jgi:hypothetical protein
MRHRGQKLAAGRRGEPNELTQGDCGSRRKLVAACRKVSRHARVAWCKRKVFRKIWTQGELWTTEGIGCSWQEDDPKYKSGTVQGTRSQEIQSGQCGTRNPERTDVREETLEGPGMQQWHNGPRSETAATRQQANNEPRHKTGAAS